MGTYLNPGNRGFERISKSGCGTVKLYDKIGDFTVSVDEIEATHIGCGYEKCDSK